MSSNKYRLKANVVNISRALAILCVAAPAFAQSQAPVSLGAVNVVGSVPVTLAPTETAPSQGSLEARSAQSIVSNDFIRNYTSPVSDYTQALTMTPGVFSYTANGVGLGDSKITMRGLTDSNMAISFDGIPFNDTNGVSHHSWAWFPSQTLGGAVVDRSPGSAATLGQATFGGNVDLRSRILESESRTSVMGSIGTWNTNVLGIEQQTGQFGAEGKSSMMFNVERTNSDGYQTYNDQHRTAISGKYQYVADADTTYTLFASYLDMTNSTGSVKGIYRSRYDAGDYTYFNSNNPLRGDFYGYNFYKLNTDFSYAGIEKSLGGGWKIDDKLYRYNYHNSQKYVGTSPETATFTATSGADKLNSYITFGNTLRLTHESDIGILRTGLWLDQSDSYRFTYKSNPLTWQNVATPDYSETYTTKTIQPYVEYEYKVSDKLSITPGVKYASYTQSFNHLADATTVGSLSGAASISHSIEYTDTLPSLDVRYKMSPNLTVYGQYAIGDQIPSTSVFDVTNAAVTVAPKPTKATTTQFGAVYNSPTYTASADVYYTELESTYTPSTTAGITTWMPTGMQYNKGVEGEINFMLGSGFSLYVNGTYGRLTYADGSRVAGAPSDTETIGLNYARDGWATGASINRVGTIYNDGAKVTTTAGVSTIPHETYQLDPVVLSNLFVNYTMKKPYSQVKQAKIQFGVNNLFDSHAITSIATAATGGSSATPKPTDVLVVLPGRSVNLTLTLDF